MSASITIDGLEVRYDDHLALASVELRVSAPLVVAVIGPNGSGKSTLLGAIAGLLSPSRGTVMVDSPTDPALVLQSTAVDRSLPITVRDVVSMGRFPHLGLLRRLTSADRRVVAAAMERLDILDLADAQLHALSGGQRQRVLVAQGIAQESDILLLDEPVTGLDVSSRSLILELIDDERRAGRLVFMTTHNLDDARRCDRVLLLDTEPIAFGPPDDVFTETNLRAAFGGRFLAIEGGVLLDDPHHEH